MARFNVTVQRVVIVPQYATIQVEAETQADAGQLGYDMHLAQDSLTWLNDDIANGAVDLNSFSVTSADELLP
jgi:hypothetical protein